MGVIINTCYGDSVLCWPTRLALFAISNFFLSPIKGHCFALPCGVFSILIRFSVRLLISTAYGTRHDLGFLPSNCYFCLRMIPLTFLVLRREIMYQQEKKKVNSVLR